MRRCGGPNISSDHSRFGEINSRLARANSRFVLLREFVGKSLICLTVFTAKQRLSGQNRSNSRFDGKNREMPQAALQAVPRGFPTTPPISGAWGRSSTEA